MVRSCNILLLALGAQIVVGNPVAASHGTVQKPGSTRPLKGKFLHITDLHIDPFYKVHSDTSKDDACHHGTGHAGFYGAPTSDCDSPETLLNATFAWIREHLRDEIDFVVWTGDSARHDNDEAFPRDADQIISQNEYAVSRFLAALGKPDNFDDDDPLNDFVVPIVPNIGNNDILPHNIFLEGPNFWTERYLRIWNQFIPEEQRHQFQRGGWFYVEVIPNKLAVFSLNTMYFFASNSAVDGCALPTEPGYEQFEWLRVQLQFLRERGAKAILIGHVPPARTEGKMSWEETCWQKYTLWMRQYRDVIVGSMYGHMNIDHFILQDFGELRKDTKNGRMKLQTEGESLFTVEDTKGFVEISSASSYLMELRNLWSQISPTSDSKRTTELSSGEENDGADAYLAKYPRESNYAVSWVSPSVIPNYFPTLRVFDYNISGLGLNDLSVAPGSGAIHPQRVSHDHQKPLTNPVSASDDSMQQQSFREYLTQTDLAIAKKKKKKKNRKGKKKEKRYKFTVPNPPSASAPPGPAYSPQPLSLLGYTQYLANLTTINNETRSKSADLSPPLDDLPSPPFDGSLSVPPEDPHSPPSAGDHTDHPFGKPKKPIPPPTPKPFEFQIEYRTHDDRIFQLVDLTVPRYVDLAHRIGARAANVAAGDLPPAEDDDPRADGRTTQAKQGGKGGNGKGNHGKTRANKTWLTFVRRALVSTLELREVEDLFGESVLEDAAA